MTKKLNLSPLINHFKSKSPSIANSLFKLTKRAQSILEVSSEVQSAVDHLKSFYDQIGQEARPISQRWQGREHLVDLPPIPKYVLKASANPSDVKLALDLVKKAVIKEILSSDEFKAGAKTMYANQFAEITDGAEFLKWYTTFTQRAQANFDEVVQIHQKKSAADKWMDENCTDTAIMEAYKTLQRPDFQKKVYQTYKNSGSSKAREQAKQLLMQEHQLMKQKTSSTNPRLSKIATTLVEIADELDVVDPELAKSADLLLQELLKEASGMCPLMGKEGHACTEMCMRPLMDEDMFPEDSESKSFSVQDIVDQGYHDHDEEPEEVLEIEDPDISAPSEPEPEYDEVSLEDLDTRLDGLNWRIADRPRREALEKAKEHALKAKQYYDAFKRYKDKTHSIFDEAGEALRLKKFD